MKKSQLHPKTFVVNHLTNASRLALEKYDKDDEEESIPYADNGKQN